MCVCVQYNGVAIRKLLPVSSNDHIEMKNIFWRSLFEQFDEIDGNTAIPDQDSFEVTMYYIINEC